MRKQCKRRVRLASEPAMLLKIANPEIELAHRLAIEMIPRGYATYANCYSPLADLHGLLTLGVRKTNDQSMKAALHLGSVALLNMFSRLEKTGKVGATGDELAALKAFVNTAHGWWDRQAASLLVECIHGLKAVRAAQFEAKKAAQVS